MASKKFSGVVYGTLLHDGVEYAHGEPFETDDEALFGELKRAGAVRLPSEVLSPAQVQQQAQQQAADLEMARNRIAELEAQLKAQVADKAPRKQSPE